MLEEQLRKVMEKFNEFQLDLHEYSRSTRDSNRNYAFLRKRAEEWIERDKRKRIKEANVAAYQATANPKHFALPVFTPGGKTPKATPKKEEATPSHALRACASRALVFHGARAL